MRNLIHDSFDILTTKCETAGDMKDNRASFFILLHFAINLLSPSRHRPMPAQQQHDVTSIISTAKKVKEKKIT